MNEEDARILRKYNDDESYLTDKDAVDILQAALNRTSAALVEQTDARNRLAGEVIELQAQVARLKAGLYPLNEHTPESALALAEDIGATEDSLLVQWIRRGEAIERAEKAADEIEFIADRHRDERPSHSRVMDLDVLQFRQALRGEGDWR